MILRMTTYQGPGLPPPAPPAPQMRRPERDKTEIYLMQIRNMLAWILIIMGITFISGVIVGIAAYNHANQAASVCGSLGGSNPNC